jgi:calcineurin-like phosphoesterase family protein
MKQNEFVTADTHFGHSVVIKRGRRPFQSVEEMDAELIARWNAKVPKTARVYHLGDFAFVRSARVLEILSQLNGRILIVRGNHDRRTVKGAVAAAFDDVRDHYESKTEDGVKVVMSHYPFVTWNMARYGAWMLHGHCHGNLADAGLRRLDVGLDVHPSYEPFSFEEIAERMEGRQYVAVDHHVPVD